MKIFYMAVPVDTSEESSIKSSVDRLCLVAL